MWRKHSLILPFLLLAVAAAAESSLVHVTQPADTWPLLGGGDDRSCSSGECIVANDGGEMVKTMERRVLKSSRSSKYASYGALVADYVPCFLRGKSYYECAAQSEATPYSRGCTVLTRCAKDNA